MNSEYRQKLLSLQGRLTCIQTELTEVMKEADKELMNGLPYRPHKFRQSINSFRPNCCGICGEKETYDLHLKEEAKKPKWKDITDECTLVMKESTYPPEGRTYGSLIYKSRDIAHLIVDEKHYPTLPDPADALIREGAHLILALIDKKDFRVRIQKRCWSIQRRFD